MMASRTRLAEEDNDDPPLRPTWDETEDETDIDLARPAGLQDQSDPADACCALLVPLCAATDALARLDARIEAAATAIREGLIARLAYLEAAGFLAHAHAWAHPLDLALRERGLTASAALAAAGGADRALPQTVGWIRRWTNSPPAMSRWPRPWRLPGRCIGWRASTGEQPSPTQRRRRRCCKRSARAGWTRRSSPPGGMPSP